MIIKDQLTVLVGVPVVLVGVPVVYILDINMFMLCCAACASVCCGGLA